MITSCESEHQAANVVANAHLQVESCWKIATWRTLFHRFQVLIETVGIETSDNVTIKKPKKKPQREKKKLKAFESSSFTLGSLYIYIFIYLFIWDFKRAQSMNCV